jgi:predicted metal-dependent peptidase
MYNASKSLPVITQAKTKLERGHQQLMQHIETRFLSGVIMVGESTVIEAKDSAIKTAYTDGLNKRYVAEYIVKQDQTVINGTILHENLHNALMQLPRMKELPDRNLANKAADYVVNDIIHHIKDKNLCRLGEGWLYDPMFHGWTVHQIYRYLKQEQESQQEDKPEPQDEKGEDGEQGEQDKPEPPQAGNGHPKDGRGDAAPQAAKRAEESQDEHDVDAAEERSPEEEKQVEAQIQQALEQGSMIAAAMGKAVPQKIRAAMNPKIDWVGVTRDFVTESLRGGADQHTWRSFDRRTLIHDVYLPDTETETLGRGLISFDASGSTVGPEMGKFISSTQVLLVEMPPQEVRVLWWDDRVRSEQTFTPENYSAFTSLARCVGGGGTRVSCVDKYMRDHGIRPDFHIIFTDGYVESNIDWRGDRSIPTLWIVTENAQFVAPFGQVVFTK